MDFTKAKWDKLIEKVNSYKPGFYIEHLSEEHGAYIRHRDCLDPDVILVWTDKDRWCMKCNCTFDGIGWHEDAVPMYGS
jgi:hypothetical protein